MEAPAKRGEHQTPRSGRQPHQGPLGPGVPVGDIHVGRPRGTVECINAVQKARQQEVAPCHALGLETQGPPGLTVDGSIGW